MTFLPLCDGCCEAARVSNEPVRIVQDGSFRKGAGGAPVGGIVALQVRSRNSAVRVTAQAWNDASNYGPYCELFFFETKRERE